MDTMDWPVNMEHMEQPCLRGESRQLWGVVSSGFREVHGHRVLRKCEILEIVKYLFIYFFRCLTHFTVVIKIN